MKYDVTGLLSEQTEQGKGGRFDPGALVVECTIFPSKKSNQHKEGSEIRIGMLRDLLVSEPLEDKADNRMLYPGRVFVQAQSRGKSDMATVHCISLDFDGVSQDVFNAAMSDLSRYALVYWSSWSHGTDPNGLVNFKVLLPLARGVTPEQASEAIFGLHAAIEGIDPATKDATRLVGMPAFHPDREDDHVPPTFVAGELFSVPDFLRDDDSTEHAQPEPQRLGDLYLARGCNVAAAAEALFDRFNEGKGRHPKSVQVAGVCARAGLSKDTTRELLRALYGSAWDAEGRSRDAEGVLAWTYSRFDEGAALPGLKKLRESFGEAETDAFLAAIGASSVLKKRSRDVGTALALLPKVEETTGPLVFAGDRWFSYDDARGVWEPLTSMRLEQVVQSFDQSMHEPGAAAVIAYFRQHLESVWKNWTGETIAKKMKPTLRMPLAWSVAEVSSVCRALERHRLHEDFFADATPGVCFRDCFVEIAEDGHAHRRAHSPEHRAQHALDIDYDEQAGCPTWLQHLQDVFEGDDDADLKRQFLQEYLGACLTGRATAYEFVLCLWGLMGGNGKSVINDFVKAAFPAGSVAGVSPTQWSDVATVRAGLNDKLVNVVDDLGRSGFHETGEFKSIVSGKSFDGRGAWNKNVGPVHSRAGHLVSFNALPGVQGQGPAFWRRVEVLTFNKSFSASPDRRDPVEYQRALRDDIPGFVLWAMEGARRLFARGGFDVPPSSVAAKAEWQSTDPLQMFIDEEYDASDTGAFVSAKKFRDEFTTWRQANGFSGAMNVATLRNRMAELGYRFSKRGGQHVFWGVQPLEPGEIQARSTGGVDPEWHANIVALKETAERTQQLLQQVVMSLLLRHHQDDMPSRQQVADLLVAEGFVDGDLIAALGAVGIRPADVTLSS
jgi:P4 family phage/plasmid primase-like protien